MEEWKSAGKIALVVPSVPRWEKPALCIPVFPLKKEKMSRCCFYCQQSGGMGSEEAACGSRGTSAEAALNQCQNSIKLVSNQQQISAKTAPN